MIKKWWKPWGKEYTAIDVIQDGREECLMFRDVPKRQMQAYTFRSLVSIESGFWQFVCKNKLHKKTDNFWENVSKTSTNIWWFNHNHQYRLLESALILGVGIYFFDSFFNNDWCYNLYQCTRKKERNWHIKVNRSFKEKYISSI